MDIKEQWRQLDQQVRGWWDGDIKQATEAQIRDPEANKVWYSDAEHQEIEQREEFSLLFLPFPYISAAGSEAAFPEMYCWDTYFINTGLLHHGRTDLVYNHLLNHLFLILRFGKVLNGNRTFYTTRSQTPLLAADVWRYYEKTGDMDLLLLAYPLLKKQYNEYWDADHHRTPIGLATNRDLGDPSLRPELAAEGEIMDFTPIFGGDVRNCVPIQTNCALVMNTEVLHKIASLTGLSKEAAHWLEITNQRKERIREYCWNEEKQFFFEYNYVEARQLEYYSVCAYWTLWAGVATKTQAAAMAKQLHRIECDHGISITDRIYPSPHPEYEWLQFEYPSGWPPMQMITVAALQRYGYNEDAHRIADKYLRLMLKIHDETGYLWEKYNVADGNLSFPKERYKLPRFHGWSSAAIVDLGRVLFDI